MKLLVALCFLVTLCAAQRVPSNTLQQAAQAVNTAKTNVQNIMSDMERSKRDVTNQMSNQIFNIYMRDSSTLISTRDDRLKYIKEKSEEAKNGGKDVDSCIDPVAKNVRDVANIGYDDLGKCQNLAKQQLNQILQPYDDEKANGQQLIARFDRIVLNCYNSNTVQMVSCIYVQLGLVNQDVRLYKQKIGQIDSQVQREKWNVSTAQNTCDNTALSKVRSASSDAIYAVANCLKN